MADDLVYEICPKCGNSDTPGIIERDIETECGWRATLVTCDVCFGDGKILREYEPENEDDV